MRKKKSINEKKKKFCDSNEHGSIFLLKRHWHGKANNMHGCVLSKTNENEFPNEMNRFFRSGKQMIFTKMTGEWKKKKEQNKSKIKEKKNEGRENEIQQE